PARRGRRAWRPDCRGQTSEFSSLCLLIAPGEGRDDLFRAVAPNDLVPAPLADPRSVLRPPSGVDIGSDIIESAAIRDGQHHAGDRSGGVVRFVGDGPGDDTALRPWEGIACSWGKRTFAYRREDGKVGPGVQDSGLVDHETAFDQLAVVG